MKKIILLFAFILSTTALFAQTIGTYKFVTFNDYELQYTVTKLSPAECSVKLYRLTTDNLIDVIEFPEVMEIEGKEFTVTTIPNSAFEYCYSVQKFKLPNTITTIGNRAFYYCSLATEIEMPESVTFIGNEAFYGCEITEVIIPSGITKINNATFRNCRSLSNVVIPNTVTSIGTLAFNGCLVLTEIELPESIQTIEDYAFSGCTRLTLVRCLAPVPPTGKYILYNTNKDIIVRVPAEYVDLYKSTAPWSEYDIRAIGAEDETDGERINEEVVTLGIYPNPVSHNLVIETNANIEEVSIYDALGRQQVSLTPSQQENMITINVSNLNDGVYFIKTRTDKGEIVDRFVKN